MPTHGLERLIEYMPDHDPAVTIQLLQQGSWRAAPHSVAYDALVAMVSAVGAGRPLLVEGEPGAGKSHLARAAAELLNWHFISFVVQPDTEYTDLLWQTDLTARLGKAQLLSAIQSQDEKTSVNFEDELALEHFVSAGPLWFAYDFDSDTLQNKMGHYFPETELEPLDGDERRSENGVVLLIDEIDKADVSVCNGLLEALGNNSFNVPALNHTVPENDSKTPPLIVLTSNQTRHLPPAFLRRCVRFHVAWPDSELEGIGKMHCPELSDSVLERCADLIRNDRDLYPEPPLSGTSEYLDLCKALQALVSRGESADTWLDRLGQRMLKGARR